VAVLVLDVVGLIVVDGVVEMVVVVVPAVVVVVIVGMDVEVGSGTNNSPDCPPPTLKSEPEHPLCMNCSLLLASRVSRNLTTFLVTHK
jgi:hypothetical protein